MGPVTDTHRLTYKENVRLAVQEQKALYDDAFMFDANLKGEKAQITDIISASEARENAPEGGDTPNIESQHEPVWVTPTRLDWGKVIEKGDAIRALTDYKSPYVQNGAKAMVRGKNKVLAGSLFANRLIGKQGASTAAWAGSTVPVDLDTPATPHKMTVSKILRAFRLLEDADVNVEEEDLFLALDPLENEDLYKDITFVSKDYRDKAVIEEKRVKMILGVPILPGKRLSTYDPDANTSVAALWAKRGMVWGEFSALEVQSTRNPARQYREHPYMEQYLGATRIEDVLVVKILNKKA